jgi:hypothetical protein
MNSPLPSEPTARKSFLRYVPLIVVAGLAVWLTVSIVRSLNRERGAAELRAAGFEAGSESLLKAIRKNWRGAFNAVTSKNRREWSARARLMSSNVRDLNTYSTALTRFEPREVLLGFCPNLEDVSALRNLPNLERLDFYECPKVNDLSIVSEFRKLRELTLRDNPALRSLDIIKSGKELRSLHIWRCRALEDLQSLRDLTSLRSLYLADCVSLKDTELLRGLSLLEELDLSGCGN